jgi:hypothetical protein
MSHKKHLISSVFLTGFLSVNAFSQVNIFTEDFQGGIPATWVLRNFDGLTPASAVSEYTSAWISKVDIDSSVNFVASSTSFFAPIGTANRWLISPPINLGAFGNFISWNAKSHDPSFPDNYLVLVSKTDTAITSFTDTIGYVIGEYANWTERSKNLSSLGLDNETVYFAFVLQTEDGFKLYIDDVKVRKDDPVGLDETQYDFLKIETLSPGLFKLKIGNDIVASKVFNCTGKLVLATSESIIDLRKEDKGVFFLQVDTDNGLINKKLINF